MKIERGMPQKRTERQKVYKTISGKVAYIATMGYLRVYNTFKELKECAELQNHYANVLGEDLKEWYTDAEIKYERGMLLFVFYPYKTENDHLTVMQFKSGDLAKSMLNFINLVFPYIYEDYKLLEINQTYNEKQRMDKLLLKQEIAKENADAIKPSPANSIEYVYINEKDVLVKLNGNEIGHIKYEGMHKKTGWHTIVPKCRDKYRPRIFATYNRLQAAKDRIEMEYGLK